MLFYEPLSRKKKPATTQCFLIVPIFDFLFCEESILDLLRCRFLLCHSYTGIKRKNKLIRRLLLLFSHSVLSDSLWPYGLQQASLFHPSLSPGVCSNSRALSWWSRRRLARSQFRAQLSTFPTACQPGRWHPGHCSPRNISAERFCTVSSWTRDKPQTPLLQASLSYCCFLDLPEVSSFQSMATGLSKWPPIRPSRDSEGFCILQATRNTCEHAQQDRPGDHSRMLNSGQAVPRVPARSHIPAGPQLRVVTLTSLWSPVLVHRQQSIDISCFLLFKNFLK